jgi:hypothetical protein
MIELTDFVTKISNLVTKHQIPFIDATLKLCEDENYEIEHLAGIIRNNPLLFTKIEEEAAALHFIPKIDKLPL